MDNIQKISIDIMNNKSYEYIYAKQYDVGRQIVFTVTEDNKEKDLTDMDVIFEMMKPDGYLIFDHIPIEDNKIVLTLSDQMTVLYGKMPYQLNIFDENVLIGTVTGHFLCEKAVVQNDDIESKDEINIKEELVQKIEEAFEAARSAQETLNTVTETVVPHIDDQAEFSELQAKISKSYAVGGTDYDHSGTDDDEDNSKFYYERVKDIYNKTALAKKITLLANGWDSSTKQQEVEVDGVLADEDSQLITVRPTSASTEEYVECEVLCIQQKNDALVFKCDTIPEHDLEVYIAVQQTSNEETMGNVLYAPTSPSGGVFELRRLNYTV